MLMEASGQVRNSVCNGRSPLRALADCCMRGHPRIAPFLSRGHRRLALQEERRQRSRGRSPLSLFLAAGGSQAACI